LAGHFHLISCEKRQSPPQHNLAGSDLGQNIERVFGCFDLIDRQQRRQILPSLQTKPRNHQGELMKMRIAGTLSDPGPAQ
jgi:hypothetical protein